MVRKKNKVDKKSQIILLSPRRTRSNPLKSIHAFLKRIQPHIAIKSKKNIAGNNKKKK